jgi:hypothetical protein
MEYPKNQLDALTKALVLCVTAPSGAKSEAALKLADSFSAGLGYADFEFCKREAEKLLYLNEGGVMNRSIHTIACEIQNDMDHLASTAKKPVHWTEKYPYAVPYVSAMLTMHKISDSYYLDSGREIVQRFLCNASQWKGEKAKAIKLELKSML